MLGTTWVGEFAATGAFEPTPEGLVDESSFFEGSWGTAVVDDVAYGVPWYVDTRVLYYRTDMAEAAGVEPPTTWDEYKAFAQALKDQGATSGVSLPPGGFDSWQYVTAARLAAGRRRHDRGRLGVRVRHPRVAGGVRLLRELLRRGPRRARAP